MFILSLTAVCIMIIAKSFITYGYNSVNVADNAACKLVKNVYICLKNTNGQTVTNPPVALPGPANIKSPPDP